MHVQWFTFEPKKDRGKYHHAIVESGGHRVEVTCSPTGRNVYVYINGKRVDL